MGRAILDALDEVLHRKGIEVIHTQADWHNSKMLQFFAGAGLPLAPRHVLERDTGYLDDHVVGFVIARVDFGEFNRTEPAAVLDGIAVDPDYMHGLVGTALLSQLLTNLSALQIEVVRSETDAEHFEVLKFL